MKADRRVVAWELVTAYMQKHMHEVPKSKRSKFTEIDQSRIAPLGALVSFELTRRNISYAQAAIEIGRKLPEWLREAGPSIASSTLFYFKHEERAYWSAQPSTLQQLAYGFDWDLTWLQRINCDPIEDAAALPESIARVVQLMRELPEEMHGTIYNWVETYAQTRTKPARRRQQHADRAA